MDRLQTIGIVGAGAKGREVASLALLGGFRVILEDISASRLAESEIEISCALDAAVGRGEIDIRRRSEIVANLSAARSMDAVSLGADLLIDAAPEDAELQLEIFTIFDKFAKPGAILASTSNSMSIAELAEMTNCPERCVGLRFPASTSRSKSLTILRAPKTDECSVQVCRDFARQLGFEANVVKQAEDPVIEGEPHRR
ncbi:MAG: 3-hydroxyacyl-CoA dehydrogenase NAD-binding domain-containing protein [Candidatus Acidiferrales bacterium]